MSILTKVAKGIAYGDVSNSSIRNILTEISKSIGGGMTEQEMYDTLDFFDWKCPYTGKDLREAIENRRGGYATDHIYPQNKEWCGLNVKGNLVLVDKAANAKKGGNDVETFLLNDTTVLGNLDQETRQARLEKIKEFQKKCGYDPEKIRTIVSPLLKKRYSEVREEQEKCISDAMDALRNIGIKVVSPTVVAKEPVKHMKKSCLTEIVFHPEDEETFKQELLQRKKAHFLLSYDSGATKETEWKANHFTEESNLRANIQGRPFWRKRKSEGLIKVDVYIE